MQEITSIINKKMLKKEKIKREEEEAEEEVEEAEEVEEEAILIKEDPKKVKETMIPIHNVKKMRIIL